MFCTATGVWEENVGCGGPVDATTQPVDGGRGASDSADSGRDASPPHADAEAGHSDDSGRDANHSADSGRDASPPHADAEAGHSADSGHG
jgi:hypothetical protein